MKNLILKLLWGVVGMIIGGALVFLLRPAKRPIVLFADPKSSETAALTENLTLPDKAAVIMKMERGERKLEAMRQLGREWITVSEEEALNYRDTIQYQAMRQAFDQGAMPILAQTDPEKTLQMIEAGPWFPDQWPVERDALLNLATKNPEIVMEKIRGREPPERYQSIGAAAARQLSTSSPKAAAEFAATMPEGQIKQNFFGTLVATWAREDSLAASQWLQKLGSGKSRDAAVASFVNVIRLESPDEAFVWAGSIEDPALRFASMKKVVDFWLQQGKYGAVRAAVSGAELSEEERKSLLGALPEPGG